VLLILLIVPQKYRKATTIFVAQKEKPKNIGRPKLPKGEAKTEMVRARVTASEMKAIAKAAGSAGVSEWARSVMLSAAQ
jgi:hypothetical protein